jgi:hypothetical protein
MAERTGLEGETEIKWLGARSKPLHPIRECHAQASARVTGRTAIGRAEARRRGLRASSDIYRARLVTGTVS